MSSAHARIQAMRSDYERWAFTCIRIKDKREKLVPFRLRPLQRAIGVAEAKMRARTGKARLYVLKGRQGGISTDQQIRALHEIWSRRGATSLTLAHERSATDKIFTITQRALDHFPQGLLPQLGEKAAKEVSFPRRDSVFYTGTAGAKRSGRGLTLTRFHGSEFAFWDDPMVVLSAVLAAMEKPNTAAVLETTASGYNSAGHVFWQECKARGWEPLFYPWWECDPEMYRTPLLAPDELGQLTDEERLLVSRGLDMEQLKWRREKIREQGRDLFLQEYAEDEETCWLAPGGMFYDAEQLKALLLQAVEPMLVVPHRLGGEVEVYAARPENAKVILGGDVAEGVGGDSSTFVARAFTPAWPLLAAYKCETVDPIAYAAILNEWGRKLADKGGPALLVVEKNAHGITVLRQLRDIHKYPASRIYHRTAQDRDAKERTERIGWLTSEETKPLMLDGGRELLTACAEGRAAMPPKSALRDAFGVRRDPETGRVKLNGRDMLVAELLAWQGRGAVVSIPDLPPLHY